MSQKQGKAKGRKRTTDDYSNADTDDDYQPHCDAVRSIKRELATKNDVTQAKRSKVDAKAQQQKQHKAQRQQPVSTAVDSAVWQPVCSPQHNATYVAAASGTAAATKQQQPEPASSTSESKAQHPTVPTPTAEYGNHNVVASAAASPDCCMSSAPAARDQDCASQLQQQQAQQQVSSRGCAPQPAACADPAWDDMLLAFADGATPADDCMDVHLLRQLELELAEEQQQRRSKSAMMQQLQGQTSAAAPTPVACQGPAQPAIAAAAKVAAALVGNIGSMLEPQSSVTQPSGHKMELVNKLIEAWYDDDMCDEEADLPDTVTEHLQQHFVGQITTVGSNQPSPAAVGIHQQQPAAAMDRQCSYALECQGSAPSVGLMQPVDCQQQTAVSRGQCFTAPHVATSAAASSSMFAATSAPVTSAAPSPPAAAAAAQVAAVQRLVMLQRKVQEMSSQLAQLQGVMAKSVEELVMMAPPAQQMPGQQLIAQQITAQPRMTQQVCMGLTHQQSMNSNSSTATELQMRFRQQQQQAWAGPGAGFLC